MYGKLTRIYYHDDMPASQIPIVLEVKPIGKAKGNNHVVYSGYVNIHRDNDHWCRREIIADFWDPDAFIVCRLSKDAPIIAIGQTFDTVSFDQLQDHAVMPWEFAERVIKEQDFTCVVNEFANFCKHPDNNQVVLSFVIASHKCSPSVIVHRE